MDDLRNNRLFRCLVCLLLVCCILINCSPIRAEAAVAETTLYALGLAAILLLGTCGVVFNPTSTAQVEAIGQSWSDHMYSAATTDEEIEIVDVTLGIVFEEMTSPPEDPRLSSGLWSAFFMGKALEWVERFLRGNSISTTAPNNYGYQWFDSGSLIPVGTQVFGAPFDGSVLTWSFSSPCNVYRWYGDDGIYSIGVVALAQHSFTCSRYVDGLNAGSSISNSIVIDGKSYFYFVDRTTSYSYSIIEPFLPGCQYVDCGRNVSSWDSIISSLLGGAAVSVPIHSTIFPDIITGGIKSALDDGHDIQDITLPDIEYGNIITEGQTLEEALTQTQSQLINGTMTWEQYVDLLTNGNGINITINNGGGTSNQYPIENGGVSSTPLMPEQLTPYVVDLRDFFPFCIPFDLYDFFSLLAAEPEAPVFHWEIQDLAGNVYPIDIDLSSWDTFALVFRKMQLLVFVIGLAMASRKFIKW